MNSLSDPTNYRTYIVEPKVLGEGNRSKSSRNRGRRGSRIADELEGIRAGGDSGCAMSRWRGLWLADRRRAEVDAADSMGRRRSRSVAV